MIHKSNSDGNHHVKAAGIVKGRLNVFFFFILIKSNHDVLILSPFIVAIAKLVGQLVKNENLNNC